MKFSENVTCHNIRSHREGVIISKVTEKESFTFRKTTGGGQINHQPF